MFDIVFATDKGPPVPDLSLYRHVILNDEERNIFKTIVPICLDALETTRVSMQEQMDGLDTATETFLKTVPTVDASTIRGRIVQMSSAMDSAQEMTNNIRTYWDDMLENHIELGDLVDLLSWINQQYHVQMRVVDNTRMVRTTLTGALNDAEL